MSKNRRRLTVHSISVIGVVLTCVAGVLPGLLSGIVSQEWGRKLETLSLVMAGVTILIVVNLIYSFTANQSDEMVSRLAELEQARCVRTLSSHEMYAELLRYVQGAQNRFYTCYFGDHPPNNSPRVKREYHESVIPLAKKRSDLSFRRIVLLTEKNLPWIRDLADKCTNVSNASLSVYCPANRTSIPLSVQLIDQVSAVLVHPSRKPPGAARDIVLLDRTAVHLLDGYYDRIWQVSKPIVVQGELMPGALDDLAGAVSSIPMGILEDE